MKGGKEREREREQRIMCIVDSLIFCVSLMRKRLSVFYGVRANCVREGGFLIELKQKINKLIDF